MSTSLPRNYEAVQTEFTSSSRGTRMGRRITKNISECSQYLQPPVLCVGCGDGWELEQLAKSMNVEPKKNIIEGIEVTSSRVEIAKQHNLPVHLGSAENMLDIIGDKKFNILCMHTLEHCFNIQLAIENFKKAALDTIVIIVPIEVKGRTRNRAHYSPISGLGKIANMFGMDYEITISYNWCIELQGRLIVKRHLMNWPEKLKGSRSSELLIK